MTCEVWAAIPYKRSQLDFYTILKGEVRSFGLSGQKKTGFGFVLTKFFKLKANEVADFYPLRLV
ncbi:MAG TPA: hypothetical protein PKA00_07355 [Saprospiraceae bacterium]|nr:hypothetical protein [Saprospiraceae bacterium]HMQ82707.1 hypothetical protein [Saprospiraceae bacterium]